MGTDMEIVGEIWKEGQWHPIPDSEITVDPGRNYELYAVLANMRSSRITDISHTRFTPISKPRGMPLDISERNLAICSGHQHPSFGLSWLKIQEIIDYDWDNQFVVTTGYIQPKYSYLFKEGEPLSTPPKKVKFHRLPKPEMVKVSYLMSYREYIVPDYFIAGLMQLGDPHQVRIIIWFD